MAVSGSLIEFPLLLHHPASIRAYGAQARVIRESMDRIDRHTRTTRAFYNLNRWISMRGSLLSGLFSSSLAAYFVYGQRQSALNAGFVLNMASELT